MKNLILKKVFIHTIIFILIIYLIEFIIFEDADNELII